MPLTLFVPMWQHMKPALSIAYLCIFRFEMPVRRPMYHCLGVISEYMVPFFFFSCRSLRRRKPSPVGALWHTDSQRESQGQGEGSGYLQVPTDQWLCCIQASGHPISRFPDVHWDSNWRWTQWTTRWRVQNTHPRFPLVAVVEHLTKNSLEEKGLIWSHTSGWQAVFSKVTMAGGWSCWSHHCQEQRKRSAHTVSASKLSLPFHNAGPPNMERSHPLSGLFFPQQFRATKAVPPQTCPQANLV